MYKINFTVGDECLTHIGLYTLQDQQIISPDNIKKQYKILNVM